MEFLSAGTKKVAVLERWPLAEVRLCFGLVIFHESKLVLLGLFCRVKSFTCLNKFSLSGKREI